MAARKPKAAIKAVQQESPVDKVIGLIKWVDNPFKLFTVLIIATFAFVGFFAWESREVIKSAFIAHDKLASLKSDVELLDISTALIKEAGGEVAVVHQANLMINKRTTVLAADKNGRNKSVEGTVTSIFNESPGRNKAVVAMLNGEVLCEDFKASSKVGEWFVKNEVTFVCRGSIPPEIGKLVGYISVGFKQKPDDINSVKVILNQAASKMVRQS
jgi:hypothetical protein